MQDAQSRIVRTPEVLRGDFSECLDHFWRRLPVTKKELSALKIQIAEFCGTKVGSVTRWLSDQGEKPVGERLFRMWCYLDLQGYRVIEFETLSNLYKGIVQLIGFSIIKAEKLAQEVGYARSNNLLIVLRGTHGAGTDKERPLWDAWKNRRDLLEQKIVAWQRKALRPERPVRNDLLFLSPDPTVIKGRRPMVDLMWGLSGFLDAEGRTLFLGQADPLKSPEGEVVLRLAGQLNTLSSWLLAQKTPETRERDNGTE